MPPTRKMVVVPFNLYQDLVGRKTADIEEEGPLKLAHQELEKVKRRRPRTGAKLSAKNVQYQQKLRGFLRARKRLVNKPVKVQIGDTGLALPRQQPISPTVAPALIPPPITPAASVTPKSQIKSFSGSESDVFHSPQEKRTARKKSRGETGTAAGDLFTLISSNPKEFGLSSSGLQIINPSRNSPFKGSETLKSIRHILRGGEPGHLTPPGTSKLHNKLLKNPETKALLDQARVLFGKGKKKKKKVVRFAFRPSKW